MKSYVLFQQNIVTNISPTDEKHNKTSKSKSEKKSKISPNSDFYSKQTVWLQKSQPFSL